MQSIFSILLKILENDVKLSSEDSTRIWYSVLSNIVWTDNQPKQLNQKSLPACKFGNVINDK